MSIYSTNCWFDYIVRSYPREYTRSHQNSAVKHEWARLVLGLVTTWESLVPYVLFLHHCPSFLLITYSFGPVEPIRIEDEHWSKGKGKPRGPEINSLIWVEFGGRCRSADQRSADKEQSLNKSCCRWYCKRLLMILLQGNISLIVWLIGVNFT